MTPVWEEICWSLAALEEGVWPRGPSEGGTYATRRLMALWRVPLWQAAFFVSYIS